MCFNSAGLTLNDTKSSRLSACLYHLITLRLQLHWTPHLPIQRPGWDRDSFRGDIKYYLCDWTPSLIHHSLGGPIPGPLSLPFYCFQDCHGRLANLGTIDDPLLLTLTATSLLRGFSIRSGAKSSLPGSHFQKVMVVHGSRQWQIDDGGVGPYKDQM